jgi:chromosome segregation ATPase
LSSGSATPNARKPVAPTPCASPKTTRQNGRGLHQAQREQALKQGAMGMEGERLKSLAGYGIEGLKAKTEAETTHLQAEAMAFKTKRLATAEARTMESEAGIDVSQLETETELAKKSESKLEKKYVKADESSKTRANQAKLQNEIDELTQKISNSEAELKQIEQKIETTFQELTNKKISESVYKERDQRLREKEKRLEKQIDLLQEQLKRKEEQLE